MPIISFQLCNQVINDQLNDYNENRTVMNLVLFKDAIEHVLRISRGITALYGHMLLVGLGGSGKTISCSSGSRPCQLFGLPDHFGEQLRNGRVQCGSSQSFHPSWWKEDSVFLMTDAQIDRNHFSMVKGDMKVNGIQFTPDDAMKFFTERVHQNLRVIFCQSPSGDTFRIRARRFPALINCMIIDWLHSWSDNALYSVAKSFLSDLELDGNDTEVIVQFIANAH